MEKEDLTELKENISVGSVSDKEIIPEDVSNFELDFEGLIDEADTEIHNFQSSPNIQKFNRRRKKNVEITRDILDEARIVYLYPFLAKNKGNNNYVRFMMELGENEFWNEINYLIEDHRPLDIANLVKKKFLRKNKNYGWDKKHEVEWVKKSDSPYVALTKSEQRRYINKIVNVFYSKFMEIEKTFEKAKIEPKRGYVITGRIKGGKIKYHFVEHKKDIGKNTGINSKNRKSTFRVKKLYYLNKNKGGYLIRTPGGRIVSKLNFIKPEEIEINERRFKDIDYERARLEYIINKLNNIESSCKERLNASADLFALEFDLNHYEKEFSGLEKELENGFFEKIIYKKHSIETSNLPVTGPKISKSRAKKLFKQLRGIYEIKSRINLRLFDLEKKIRLYEENEVTADEVRPVKITRSIRTNKSVIPNTKLLKAIENIKLLAERYYDIGMFKEAETLRNTLAYIDKPYDLHTDSENRIKLIQKNQSKGKNKYSELNVDMQDVIKIYYNLKRLLGDIYITSEEKGLIVNRFERIPSLINLKKRQDLVFTTDYNGKRVEVRFQWNYNNSCYSVTLDNISPSIINSDYNPYEDPFLKQDSQTIPKDYDGYKGDIVFDREQRRYFFKNLKSFGLKPYKITGDDKEIVKFYNDPSARIEIYKEEIGGIMYYRASIFGNIPTVELKQVSHNKIRLEGRIDRALYKPVN